jgi:hypothetical protein
MMFLYSYLISSTFKSIVRQEFAICTSLYVSNIVKGEDKREKRVEIQKRKMLSS